MPEILILSHTWPDLQRFASLKYWIWFFQHHLCHRQCGHQPKHQWLSNVHLDHAVQHSTILIQKIRVNWDSRWANVSVQLRFNIWFGANCFICFCFFLFFFSFYRRTISFNCWIVSMKIGMRDPSMGELDTSLSLTFKSLPRCHKQLFFIFI